MTDLGVRTGQWVEVAGNSARVLENGEIVREHEITELPEKFVQWQLDYKRRVYEAIEKDQYIAFNAGHLPVVATVNDAGLIPNMANKGVGFTPKDEYVELYLKKVEDAVEQIIKLPPHAVDETRNLRIGTAREFYKHPEPSSYGLNKVLYELRLSSELRKRFFKDTQGVAKEYGLNAKESAALETIKDENIDALRSLKPHPLVDAGAHALGMLMCLVVVQAEQRRMRAAGEL